MLNSSAQAPLSHLVTVVNHNFQLLQEKYQLGLFESNILVVDYQTKNSPKQAKNSPTLFILFSDNRTKLESDEEIFQATVDLPLKKGKNQQFAEAVTLKSAVDRLYEQTKALAARSERAHLLLILEAKVLIYECLEYFSIKRAELGEEFSNYSREIVQILRSSGLKTVPGISEYARTTLNLPAEVESSKLLKALKILLLAALGGISYFYHQHEAATYRTGLDYIYELNNFINRDFQRFKLHPGPSLGLSGLAYFLTGMLERASGGDYLIKAEKSFISSLNSYSQRVVQKEFYRAKGWISDEKYSRQVSLSLRRTALVSTLGLSYLFLTMGKLSQAEMALILPRAVLRQNSGRVFSVYADMLYWAIQRAKYSDRKDIIEEVIKGLTSCLEEFKSFVSGTNYEHRCHLELALAYRYQARFFEDETLKSESFEKAIDFASRVVTFAGGSSLADAHNPELFKPRNPRLLAESLFIRSHLFRLKPKPNLSKAREDADNALKQVVESNSIKIESINITADVLIANAAVYKKFAEEKRKSDDLAEYEKNFSKAESYLLRALQINNNGNLRISAVCYLRLSSLFLLRENGYSKSRSFFDRWKEISDSVEHAFCFVYADRIKKELLLPNKHQIIIDLREPMDYQELCETIRSLKFEAILEKVRNELPHNVTISKARSKLRKTIETEMGVTTNPANDYINKYNLFERLGFE